MPITKNKGAAEVGTIAHFAGSTAPAGWLKANGAAISRTSYAALFLAIGTTYGVGDGSTTFNIPDMRGQFLRGFDDARGSDPGRVNGSWQNHQTAYHKHRQQWGEMGAGVWGNTATSGKQGSGSTDGDNFWFSTNDGSDYDGVVNPAGLMGSESRPVNVAMLACIKY